MGIRKKKVFTVLLFLVPFMAIYTIFQVYPLFHALISSLFKWDLLTSDMTFAGLKNYTRMFTDSTFWISFVNTLKFVVFSTPVIIGLGLLFALMLNGSGSGKNSLRTMFFAPYVLSVAVTTLIWGFLFNAQQGLIGRLFELLGLTPLYWLTDPRLAMWAIIICTLWWTVGFNMVLLLAGLQDIEPALYEAASIDGSSPLQSFLYITLPSLHRTLLLVTVLQVIASFQIFGQVYILTRGGPGGTTRVLIQYIYETGFRDYQLGYASAMAVFLFVVMFLVSFLQLSLKKEK